MGLFLCAEPNQTLFRTTVFKLGTHPVKATGNLSTVVSVLVAVKRFEQQHPLVGTEMNGLSWLSHEWAACGFPEWSVL